MSLKIPTTQKLLNLLKIFGQAKLTMKANGTNIRYLFMSEQPSDFADYSLRTDENTEQVAGLSGLNYEVEDNTIYRKNEIVAILDSDDEYKGRVKITDKNEDGITITVEKLEISGSFDLATDDKILIASDEVLIDSIDEILIEVNPSHRFLLVVADEEIADNLQITKTDLKKKI